MALITSGFVSSRAAARVSAAEAETFAAGSQTTRSHHIPFKVRVKALEARALEARADPMAHALARPFGQHILRAKHGLCSIVIARITSDGGQIRILAPFCHKSSGVLFSSPTRNLQQLSRSNRRSDVLFSETTHGELCLSVSCATASVASVPAVPQRERPTMPTELPPGLDRPLDMPPEASGVRQVGLHHRSLCSKRGLCSVVMALITSVYKQRPEVSGVRQVKYRGMIVIIAHCP